MSADNQPPVAGEAAHTLPVLLIDDGMIHIEDQAAMLVEDVGTSREWVAVGPANDSDTPNQPSEVLLLCHPINAPAIVRACNAYDSDQRKIKTMTEVLELVAKETVYDSREDRSYPSRNAELARAALALVKEGPS